MNTTPIDFKHIKVFDKNMDLIGYVAEVKGRGLIVQCKIVNRPWRLPTRRCKSIYSAAKNASVCLAPDGTKYYPSRDSLTFEIVEA